MRLIPFVVGPDEIPVVVSVEEAVRLPELAMLSVLAHRGEEEKTMIACAAGMNTLSEQDFRVYYGYLDSALKRAALKNWDALMANPTFTYRSEFARRFIDTGKAEGKAEANAESVLSVLTHRGLTIPDHVHERVTSCADIDRLNAWFDRAFSVDTAEDIFR